MPRGHVDMENSGHSFGLVFFAQRFSGFSGPTGRHREPTWSHCPVGLTLASTPCFWHLSLGDWEIGRFGRLPSGNLT